MKRGELMAITNKKSFIDNIKVVLIFLVVFGHLIERYIDTSNTLMGILLFIYIFHMPLFIFIAGLFISYIFGKQQNDTP